MVRHRVCENDAKASNHGSLGKLEAPRRQAGQRHAQTLCLALFTWAVVAGNQGFLTIGNWLTSYRDQ